MKEISTYLVLTEVCARTYFKDLQRFANDFTAHFPEFWGSAVELLGKGMYNFQNIVSRKFVEQAGRRGDTLHVPIESDVVESDDWTPGDNINFKKDDTAKEVLVKLDQSKIQPFALTAEELTMSSVNLLRMKALPAIEGLLRDVNRFIYDLAKSTKNFVGTPGGTINGDSVISLRKLMNKALAPVNRALVLSDDHEADLLKVDEFKKANESGSDIAMREGELMRKYGFSIRRNSVNDIYTPADLVGAVDNVGGYPAGTTTMIVDGFDDDANLIKAGDIFTVAGETGTPDHTITVKPLLTAGDTTSITFSPALVSSVIDSAVITIVESQSSIGLTPSSIAFAAAPYNPLPDGLGIRQSLTDFNGLPILVTVSAGNDNYDLRVSYSTLFGGVVVDAQKIARLIS